MKELRSVCKTCIKIQRVKKMKPIRFFRSDKRWHIARRNSRNTLCGLRYQKKESKLGYPKEQSK